MLLEVEAGPVAALALANTAPDTDGAGVRDGENVADAEEVADAAPLAATVAALAARDGAPVAVGLALW
jgi:hypothetical protein